MKKGRPKKARKERITNAVHTYLNDDDYKIFVKKTKEKGYATHAAYLRDIIHAHIRGIKR